MHAQVLFAVLSLLATRLHGMTLPEPSLEARAMQTPTPTTPPTTTTSDGSALDFSSIDSVLMAPFTALGAIASSEYSSALAAAKTASPTIAPGSGGYLNVSFSDNIITYGGITPSDIVNMVASQCVADHEICSNKPTDTPSQAGPNGGGAEDITLTLNVAGQYNAQVASEIIQAFQMAFAAPGVVTQTQGTWANECGSYESYCPNEGGTPFTTYSGPDSWSVAYNDPDTNAVSAITGYLTVTVDGLGGGFCGTLGDITAQVVNAINGEVGTGFFLFRDLICMNSSS